MTNDPSNAGKYMTSIKDARGVVIGDDNTIYQTFLSAGYAPLAHKLITFSTLIEEKTKDFVGRHFVVKQLDEFMKRSPSGYFIIKGEAGIGKSALMAHLVKEQKYVHHFVVGTQGINRADQFLANVCAQLIAKYKLDRPAWLPPEASRDSAFFGSLLEEVSPGLAEKEKAIILVDALDEVDWRAHPWENVLYLPPSLPDGIVMVVTSRHKGDMPLQVEQSQVFYLDPDSPGNQEDVLAYISQFARREAIQQRLQAWDTTVDELAQTMLDKSEGNFMYLHYVLPAIERGEFVNGTLAELPQGLKDYYERHWRQIRTVNEDTWVEFRQPVICYLAVAREPVTVWQVADWAKVPPARVLAAVRDWREFLEEEARDEGKRYRIYHASFQDFLADKDEAKEINLRQSHSNVADELLRQWETMRAGRALQQPTHPIPEIDYVRGLQRLQSLLNEEAPELEADFLTLEARMLENLNVEARYGATDTLRTERMEVVEALNSLASQAGLAFSYNQLCQ